MLPFNLAPSIQQILENVCLNEYRFVFKLIKHNQIDIQAKNLKPPQSQHLFPNFLYVLTHQ